MVDAVLLHTVTDHDHVMYQPCRSLSSSLEPVEIWMISALLWWNSVAVVNPIGTSLAASV